MLIYLSESDLDFLNLPNNLLSLLEKLNTTFTNLKSLSITCYDMDISTRNVILSFAFGNTIR